MTTSASPEILLKSKAFSIAPNDLARVDPFFSRYFLYYCHMNTIQNIRNMEIRPLCLKTGKESTNEPPYRECCVFDFPLLSKFVRGNLEDDVLNSGGMHWKRSPPGAEGSSNCCTSWVSQ